MTPTLPPLSPSPQVLASVVAAVGAFIKGGGLKRLLEAVPPIARTIYTCIEVPHCTVLPSSLRRPSVRGSSDL